MRLVRDESSQISTYELELRFLRAEFHVLANSVKKNRLYRYRRRFGWPSTSTWESTGFYKSQGSVWWCTVSLPRGRPPAPFLACRRRLKCRLWGGATWTLPRRSHSPWGSRRPGRTRSPRTRPRRSRPHARRRARCRSTARHPRPPYLRRLPPCAPESPRAALTSTLTSQSQLHRDCPIVSSTVAARCAIRQLWSAKPKYIESIMLQQ